MLNLTRDQVQKELHECNSRSVMDEYTRDWLAMYDLLKEIAEIAMSDKSFETNFLQAGLPMDKIRALIGGE